MSWQERIEREAGQPGLVDALERLTPSDLQTVLLEVHRRQAARLRPSQVLRHYQANRFVRPALGDAAAHLAFDLHAMGELPSGYEVVELSPLAPLGTCSVLATVHQHKVVATDRTAEVVADATNVMALESAVRRRTQAQVKLCCSHRLVRAQHFDQAGAQAHFRLLSLTVAGRSQASYRFETDTLFEMLDYCLRILPDTTTVQVTILDPALQVRVERQVFEPLALRHASAVLAFDPHRQSGRRYYVGLCFKLMLPGPVEIGDGGFTDWTAQLLGNRRERFLVGCMAPQRGLAEALATAKRI